MTDLDEISRKAIEHFGPRQQEDILIEELAELIQAIIKLRRDNNAWNRGHVIEELADVVITLNQEVLILGTEWDEIEKIVTSKLFRLAAILDEKGG